LVKKGGHQIGAKLERPATVAKQLKRVATNLAAIARRAMQDE
jgi:hypothetical protein